MTYDSALCHSGSRWRATRRWPSALAVGILLLTACGGDGGSGSIGIPGVLTASLVSPHGPEGAALFMIVGSGIEVSPLGGAMHSSQSADTTRVLVIRTVPGPIDFLISVPDITRVPSVTLVEVAAGDNQARGSLQGYSVSVAQ